jgi:hypothetical protein
MRRKAIGRGAAALLGAALLWTAAAGAMVDPVLKAEVRAAVDALVRAASPRDDAAMDAALCLDLVAPAYVERLARLGIVPDASDPARQEQCRRDFRNAAYARLDDLLRTGLSVEDVDVTRVRIPAPPGGAAETFVAPRKPGEPPTAPVTASGIAAVKFLTLADPVDVEATRIGARWCLIPASP